MRKIDRLNDMSTGLVIVQPNTQRLIAVYAEMDDDDGGYLTIDRYVMVFVDTVTGITKAEKSVDAADIIDEMRKHQRDLRKWRLVAPDGYISLDEEITITRDKFARYATEENEDTDLFYKMRCDDYALRLQELVAISEKQMSDLVSRVQQIEMDG